MAETAYPYATHLDIKFDPLTLIDVSSIATTVTDQWYNQTLCKVNDSVIRLGVMQGGYHWHKHDNDDEFFFVLSGRFIIDLAGHSIELLPNQEKWSRFFAQDAKWNFCLTAGKICPRIRRDHEEESSPEPFTGFQGEGGTRCDQGRPNTCSVV